MRATPITLALLLLPTLCWAQAGAFRGPYLSDVTSDGVTVLWESVEPTIGTVHYGATDPSELSVSSDTPATHHEVRLSGLSALVSPGERVVYELEVGGTRYPGRFFTAPAPGDPFAFVVYGDNRSSEEQHEAVVDALLAEMTDAHLVVNTGDLVGDGEIESQWDTFFAIEAPFLACTPLYVAIGNHEVHDDRWDIPRRVFSPPTTVPPESDDEGFYHFIYGNVEIIVVNVEVDTLYPGLFGFLGGDQEPWLQQVLADTPENVDHRFVFVHQGPYSSKPGRTGNFFLRFWLDDFKAAGVTAIFSGHDHYAERGFAQNGIPYIIHGGGGAPLYDTLGPRIVEDHTILFGQTRLGYVLVQVDGPHVVIQIKGLDGSVIDQFEYGNVESPECSIATDCGNAPTNGCPGGSWECFANACRYTCDSDLVSSLVTCRRHADCADSLGPQCPGQASCEMPDLVNPLTWHCSCSVQPQCVSLANCQGLPSPIADCAGTWGCQDEVCEFTPDAVCDPDDMPQGDEDMSEGDTEVVEPMGDAPDEADVGTEDVDQSDIAEDMSMQQDAGEQDTGEQDTGEQDTGEQDTGELAEPTDAASGGGEPEEGCGCGVGNDLSSVSGGTLYLLLLLGLVWSRRRAGTPPSVAIGH